MVWGRTATICFRCCSSLHNIDGHPDVSCLMVRPFVTPANIVGQMSWYGDRTATICSRQGSLLSARTSFVVTCLVEKLRVLCRAHLVGKLRDHVRTATYLIHSQPSHWNGHSLNCTLGRCQRVFVSWPLPSCTDAHGRIANAWDTFKSTDTNRNGNDTFSSTTGSDGSHLPSTAYIATHV